jgi:hypothetical protein
MRQAYPTPYEPTSLREQRARRVPVLVLVLVTLFKRARFAFCFT